MTTDTQVEQTGLNETQQQKLRTNERLRHAGEERIQQERQANAQSSRVNEREGRVPLQVRAEIKAVSRSILQKFGFINEQKEFTPGQVVKATKN